MAFLNHGDGPLDPGKLRYRVNLIRDVVSRANGVEAKEREVYATPWADVEFLSGDELWKAQTNNSLVNARVTLHFRSDVSTTDRIEWNGWRMEIKTLIPDLQKRMRLVLMCEAKRNG